jgi:uncharacterized protein (TIGR03000 family)
MRYHEVTIGSPWRKNVIGGVLVLLGMVGGILPPSQAEVRYSGARIQVRQPQTNSTPAPAVQPRSPSSPSFFPDNDTSYPSSSGEAARSVASPSSAPFGVPSAALPWNQAGFEDYDEPSRMPRDSSLSAPKKYSLEITPVPSGRAPTETAVLIAHLPEHSVFWVEGTRTRSTGRTRYFQSPPLQSGRKYGYTVRVAWIEDGQWVSQTQMVSVRAGLIQAIYLRPSPDQETKTKQEIQALKAKIMSESSQK